MSHNIRAHNTLLLIRLSAVALAVLLAAVLSSCSASDDGLDEGDAQPYSSVAESSSTIDGSTSTVAQSSSTISGSTSTVTDTTTATTATTATTGEATVSTSETTVATGSSDLKCAEEGVTVVNESTLYNEIDGEPIMMLDPGSAVLECGTQDGWFAYASLPEGIVVDCTIPVQSKVCPFGWSPVELEVEIVG